MNNLKKRIARRIARWIAPLERVEPGGLRQNPDGSVSAKHAFRSPEDAKRFARFVALQRNPLGRRAIQWLIRGSARAPFGRNGRDSSHLGEPLPRPRP